MNDKEKEIDDALESSLKKHIDEISYWLKDSLDVDVPVDAAIIGVFASVVSELERIGKCVVLASTLEGEARRRAFVDTFGADYGDIDTGYESDIDAETWKKRFDGARCIANSICDKIFHLADEKVRGVAGEIHQGQELLYLSIDGGDKNMKRCVAQESGWLSPIRVRFKNGEEIVAPVGTLWSVGRKMDLLSLANEK